MQGSRRVRVRQARMGSAAPFALAASASTIFTSALSCALIVAVGQEDLAQ